MNEELFKRIGLLIKNARDRKNLSQQEVAEYVKVTKSAVSRWENGEVGNMGRSKIQSLAELLEISPLSIITGELYSPYYIYISFNYLQGYFRHYSTIISP